jgi:hypothetical protein
MATIKSDRVTAQATSHQLRTAAGSITGQVMFDL